MYQEKMEERDYMYQEKMEERGLAIIEDNVDTSIQ